MRVVIRDPRQIECVREGLTVALPLAGGGFVVVTQHNCQRGENCLIVESFPVEEGVGGEWNVSGSQSL